MTAMPDTLDGTMLQVISGHLTQRRLEELVADPIDRAGWWVELIRQLDDLAESVQTSPGNLVDVIGFAEQIRVDAPHLLSRWGRLAIERDGLYDAVARVRLQVSRDAGDPAALTGVCRSVRDVLTRVRRHQERTTDVLLDAYERDMGGE